jgi:hypothetical protein
VGSDREAEPHVHARGICPHGNVDKTLELREGDDLVELLRHVLALQAVDRPVHVDVLPAGEVGVEAGTELEQRGDVAADL